LEHVVKIRRRFAGLHPHHKYGSCVLSPRCVIIHNSVMVCTTLYWLYARISRCRSCRSVN
jgi:hypothetical protein